MRRAERPAWKSWPIPEGDVDMWEWQDGRCAMCGCDAHRIYTRRMATDHCHDTGFVRGYLCSPCNTSEGTSRDTDWEGWRAGDNPARALGHVELYRNQFGVVPISPQSPLTYYTRAEREAWWAEVIASGRIPAEAPWSEKATARRDADFALLRDAMSGIFSPAPKADAA